MSSLENHKQFQLIFQNELRAMGSTGKKKEKETRSAIAIRHVVVRKASDPLFYDATELIGNLFEMLRLTWIQARYKPVFTN